MTVIVTVTADYTRWSAERFSKALQALDRNCTTEQVETLLRANHASIEAFDQDPALGTLCLR